MDAPRIALGTMLYGTRIAERDAFALLDRYVELGGRWIDTADCYAFWLTDDGRGDASETVIGRWLRARPDAVDHVRVSTKVGAQPVDGTGWRGWPANREGLSPAVIVRAVAGSLERLGVPAIDLLWLHQEDRATAIEHTVDAVTALAEAGAVRRLGASNHPAWRVERARAHAAHAGAIPIDATQLQLTYLEPRPGAAPEGNDHPFGPASREQLDHAAAAGLDVWAYSPLLKGAYGSRALPEAYDHPGTARRLAALDDAARGLGTDAPSVVLAWLADRAVPIVGCRTLHQVDAAMAAVATPLPEEVRARLDGVAP